MKQNVQIELYYSGAWNTAPAFTSDPIEITRNRGEEQGEPTPSTATLSLDDREQLYNPRNAQSSVYGLIGRNTPLRIRVYTPTVHYSFDATSQGWTGEGATTVARVTAPTHDGAGALRATKTMGAGADSLRFNDASGLADDISANGDTVAIWAQVPADAGGTGWLAHVEVQDSAFAWQAGTDVAMTPGEWTLLTYTPAAGLLANCRALGAQFSATGVNGSQSVYIDTVAQFGTANETRFVGEVASWKPRRTVDFDQAAGKGKAWTEVAAKGVLHRLGQGDAPLRSAAFREVNRQTSTGVVAYWACEDGGDSRSLAGSLPGMTPMRIVGGSPSLGSATNFPGSAPVIAMGSAPTAVLHGRCPVSVATGTIKFRMFAAFPAAGIGTDQVLADVYALGGSVRLWRYTYHTGSGGFYSLRGYDSTFALVEDSGGSVPGDGLDGGTWMLGFEVTQNGSDVDYETAAHRLDEDGTETGFAGGSTFTAQTVGRPDEVYIGPNAGLADVALGHIIVGDSSATVDGLENAFTGWIGETVSDRLERLCEEEGIPFITNDIGDSMPAGPQPVDTLTGQFAECERTDGGLLYETRDARGLTYRTRTSRYAMAAVLALDFDAGEVAPPLEPDVGDRGARNDILVQNRNGSSARAVQESGPLNVNDPADDPDGIGRYAAQLDVNANGDTVLPQIATWQRHLGTVAETQYPAITVDLDAAPALVTDADALDIGDVLTVDNLEPNQVAQFAPGYTEVIGSHRRLITFNCAPARPYDVFLLDTSRLATGGSDLTDAEDTTSTAWSLDVTGTALWSTTAEPYDIEVGGERVTVTTNNDASAPQAVTVTRSVNGVVKAHAAGDPVQIFQPHVLAL